MTETYKPGLHSHNVTRYAQLERPKHSAIGKLRLLLLAVGLGCIGYFAYTQADEKVYQSYQNWAFDQRKAAPAEAAPLAKEGDVLGRVTVDRLNLSAIVKQGVDDNTLREAVGHVPSTALPGQVGNFAIAAHRDTLFRGLKDIKVGDTITFETNNAKFEYRVAAMKIVKPSDVSVLHPDGGGLIKMDDKGQPPKLLTMITCYPFYYVGSAPNRFIVEAKLI